MASGQWDGSGGTMSDISSSWNMSNLGTSLPPSSTDKQSRWGTFGTDISNTVSTDVISASWGQSVTKDTNSLGWGQPDPDTGSDVGTKGWETSRSAAGIGQNPWGLTDKPGSDWDPEGKQKNGLNREFAVQWGDRSKPWGDMAPEPPSSAAQNGAPGATASTPVSAPQSAIGQPPSSSASVSTPASETVDGSGDAKQSDSNVTQPLTRDEIILRAINSNEPWGRTPIRQDTPWAIDEEPVREPLPPVPRPAPVVDPADAQYSRIGTAGWEQLRGGSNGPGWIGSGRNREDSGNWSISPADGIGLAAPGAPGVPLPPGVTPAFRAPVERPASSTGGLLAPAAVPGWGLGPGGLEAGDTMWKDDDKKAALQSAIGPAGVAQQPPIRRNLSAGNWHGDESAWNAAAASGILQDMDDVLGQGRGWRPGSRPGTAQPGQVGFRPKPDERGDNVFNVPPPALQPGFRPSSRAGSHEDIATGGQWNSLSVKQQPQTRSRILQQLTDIGFRKEEAQSALINNNMDVRLALAELMSGHPNDPSRARLLRCASEDMSHPQVGLPPGPPLDISSTSLFSPSVGPNVRFSQVSGGALPGNRQQQVVVDQLQQQQQQQRLLSTLLSSNIPPAAQTQVIQKLMQQQQQQQQVQEAQARAAISAESVQAALQQQQLQLLQSVQAAVQANLIPPNLIASVPSMSPTVANKLQRMMQLYDLFQKLNTQSQLPPAAGGGVAPEVATALTNVKQQIIMMQQEVLAALASTATVPPPPLNQMPPPPLVGVTQTPSDLMRVAGGLPSTEDVTAAAQASSKLSQWKQPTDLSKQPPNGPGSNWPVSSNVGLPLSAGEKVSDMNNGAAATSAVPASQLDIEEFVPGKPWQGPSVRSAEDDPFITPGSVTRSAISAVDDAHVMSVLGGNKMVVGSFGKPGQGAPGSKPLGTSGSTVWSSEGTDGRGQSVSSNQQPTIGRSVSWAAGDRSGAPGLAPPPMGFPGTASLRIRNLPPQMDMTLMRRWCEHFGTLQLFVPVNGDQIMLNYSRAEDAEQAQRTLSSGSPGVLPPLVIEFVSDAEVIRTIEQTRMPATVGIKPTMIETGWGAPAGIGSSVGGSMWGSGLGAEDHQGFLPSDLFGGQ